MNKKIFFVMMIACGLLSVACVNEVEEVFDTPASERLDQRMLECQSLLTSAEYGWLIEYYPDPNQSYGGSTYAAKFEMNGNVTVAGNISLLLSGDASETVTSHYSINASSSVVLTFDTYNEYIHYWSDPDGWSANQFEGDFEFAYVSGDENEMVFRGIKTDNRIVFTALSESITSSAEKSAAIEAEIVGKLYLGYRWNVGGTESSVVLYDDDIYNLLTYYPDGDRSGAYETISYTFTDVGIDFYEPKTIEGVTVQRFKWENETLVSLDATDSGGAAVSGTLAGFHNDDFMHFDNFLGTYTLLYNGQRTTVTLSEAPKSLTYKNRSFILSGVGGFDLEVGYSKSDGSLSLCSQYVGRYGSYYAWFCAWDGYEGYLTWTTSIGFKIVHNGDPENLVLTFTDNGVWGSYEVNSILYRAFTSLSPSSATSAGTISQVPLLQTMTKQ